MFNNIKLTTVSWIIGIFLAVTTLIILVSATVVQENIKFIDSTWQVYQTDRSEKARLENALRSEVGFDGMIHSFKNYVLRHQFNYKEEVIFHIASAQSIINQYRSLELNDAERAALDDLYLVLNDYAAAVRKVENMISQGRSTTDMDQVINVDDEPGLRALRTLRTEVMPKDNKSVLTSTHSKSRLAADLRAALGYGGMIHLYKNYLLRYENASNSMYNQTMVDDIEKNIRAALAVIKQYQLLGTTSAENMALEDIRDVILQYQLMTKDINSLAQQNMTIGEIDRKVKIDDSLAIRGLKILDRETYRQLGIRSQQVDETLNYVMLAIKIGKWVSVVTVTLVMILILWMLHITVIRPVTQLINSMVRLADDQLDIEIPDSQQHNEIGQMAHSVTIFKKNMVANHDSQQKLMLNQEMMEFKLDEISKLRGLADEQSRRSLALAESMAEARVSTEKMMNQLQDDKKFVNSILNAVQDGIITIDAQGIIETFNIGAEQIFGYKSFEIINKNVSILMPEPQASEHNGYLLAAKTGQSKRDQTEALEAIAIRKNGEQFPVEIMLNPIEINKEMKTMGVVRDITERKSQQEKIQLLAMTDPLTELANRHQYNASLDKEAKKSLRFNTEFALLFIDLDKFKAVNDTYGHPIGDALLQHVAKALLASCREIDLVARIGGDEFAILALGKNEADGVSVLAERIIEALSKPIMVGPHTLQVGASIGISYFPKDSADIEELTRMADEALYVAKQEGRNTYRYYCSIKA